MEESELRFLAVLHEATRIGAVRWHRNTDDPERAVYHAKVGNDQIEVEFLYVKTGDGTTAETLVVVVSGLRVYFRAAIGTTVYRAVEDILSLQMFGWADGVSGGKRSLAMATAKVEELVAAYHATQSL